MRDWMLDAIDEQALHLRLKSAAARESAAIADVLAHIGAIDARRLYVPLGYPSMVQYCLYELRLPEQAALKRIRIARLARNHPVLFEALTDARLHLSAVVLLAPHVTEANVDRLVAAAAHRTRNEIEQLLAERFPRTEPLAWTMLLQPARSASAIPEHGTTELSPGTVSFDRAKRAVTPIAKDRFELTLAIDAETHALLTEAQELLSHRLPLGDAAEVFRLALTELVTRLRKQKHGATDRPRATQPEMTRGRHIPKAIQHEVWRRDGGRCTFTSDAGVRCPSRERIEFDHVHPFALGGGTTTDNLRLRCRAHNPYAAEQQFGPEFMERKCMERRVG